MLKLASTSLLLVLFSSAAFAQTTAPDSSSGGAASADEMLNDMLKPSTQPSDGSAASTQPSVSRVSTPVASTVASGDTKTASTLREGSNIVDRTGSLKKVDGSRYVEFVFDNPSGSTKLPVMYVLPNLQLMSMQNAMAATNRQLHCAVSGTVTEYNGHNYLLLDSGPSADGDAPLTPPTSHPAASPDAPADQMLNAMLGPDGQSTDSAEPSRPSPSLPAVDRTSGSGAVAPGAPVLTVLREQSQIIDRTGRLTPTEDGQQEQFTFDSDGSSMQDPPVIILPSLKLSEMEAAAAGGGDPRFRITGVVTEYRGRNYVVLEKVVVMPTATDQF